MHPPYASATCGYPQPQLSASSVLCLARLRCQSLLFASRQALSASAGQANVANKGASDEAFFQPVLDWSSLTNPAGAAAARENARLRGADPDLIDKALKLHSEGNLTGAVELAARLPNWTHPDSPIGGEANNRLVRLIGQSPQQLDRSSEHSSTPRLDARSILEQLRLLTSRKLSLLTGHRTHFMRGQLAHLETALVNLALDTASEFGYRQIGVPELVPPELINACGFTVHGARSQVFLTSNGAGPDQPESTRAMALIGTSEVALAGYLAGGCYTLDQLPIRLCAVSRCYRREVSQVEDVLYRVPQFTKVELFSLTSPLESEAEHQRILSVQAAILTRLGLHCRLLDMATEELGSPAYRKFDWEAWLTSEHRFGELCSASNCTDYQSRRLGMRLASPANGGAEYPHTLNGTACAVTRTIKALVETHWQPDAGIVTLPPALAFYMKPFPNQLTLQRRPSMKSMYFAKLRRQPML